MGLVEVGVTPKAAESGPGRINFLFPLALEGYILLVLVFQGSSRASFCCAGTAGHLTITSCRFVPASHILTWDAPELPPTPPNWVLSPGGGVTRQSAGDKQELAPSGPCTSYLPMADLGHLGCP